MQRFLFAGAVFICLCAEASFGAVTGRISGTVKDPTGAVIPNAAVTLDHVQTGNKFESTTSSVGFYVFPSLQTGEYKLTVTSPGLML